MKLFPSCCSLKNRGKKFPLSNQREKWESEPASLLPLRGRAGPSRWKEANLRAGTGTEDQAWSGHGSSWAGDWSV